jgi:transglutaminase-like putative cysteine protease
MEALIRERAGAHCRIRAHRRDLRFRARRDSLRLQPHRRSAGLAGAGDGIGQCNTKGTLLMALLRGSGHPCRVHGFTIDKALQKGAVTGIAYRLAPRSIVHSWVEIRFAGRWVNLEGFILDKPYLQQLQQRFAGQRGAFCGFGAATPDLQNPPVDWQGADTYIQKDGIDRDFGVFDSPDEFYARHGANLSGSSAGCTRGSSATA